jgi:streptomycin 6-kinase
VNALNYFNGEGSVKLIDYNAEHNALLLEQAISGITLKSLNATKTDAIIDYYLNTMKALHRKILPKNYLYTHISDWLKALDNASPDNFPPQMLNSAINIKNKLLKTSTTQLFLHGDLHLDNILQQGNKWIAIDPKGIVGDPEFEIFAFDFIQSEDRLDSIAELIANRSGLNAQRIKEWAFVRLVLSAAWSIEDKGDPSAAIRLAEKLMNL